MTHREDFFSIRESGLRRVQAFTTFRTEAGIGSVGFAAMRALAGGKVFLEFGRIHVEADEQPALPFTLEAGGNCSFSIFKCRVVTNVGDLVRIELLDLKLSNALRFQGAQAGFDGATQVVELPTRRHLPKFGAGMSVVGFAERIVIDGGEKGVDGGRNRAIHTTKRKEGEPRTRCQPEDRHATNRYDDDNDRL